MPTNTLPQVGQGHDRSDAATPPRGPRSAVLAIGSALLLWFAFPPAESAPLAWFALAPLFLLVRSDRPARSVYLGAWAGGLVFWLLAVQWVRLADSSAWVGWLVMALYLSLYWPAFVLLARVGVNRLRLPLMVAAPIAWVALEYLRAYALTGLPWYYLAHTQYRVIPLIQIADVAGAWALSFVVAMVNAWVVDLATLPLLRPTPRGPRLAAPQVPRLAAVALLVAGLFVYGAARTRVAFPPGPRVGLLQSNFHQGLKVSMDPQEIYNVYRRLVARALRERPELIVWPETSYPRGYTILDPKLDDATLDRLVKALHDKYTAALWRGEPGRVRAEINDWVDQTGVPMLLGSTTFHFRPEGHTRYNSAILFRPGSRDEAIYHKLHLVPFGEYVPLLQTFPLIRKLAPYPEGRTPSLSFGSEAVGFDLNGHRFATAICFEDTVPHVVRRFFDQARPPDVLLNISNDGWFQGSSEHDVHLSISVFRAVENRVPLARAANMGVSAIVDGNGRIREHVPKSNEGVLVAAVPLDPRTSLYSAWGDWFAQTCLAIAIGWLVLALIPERWRRIPRGRKPPRLPGAR